MPGKRPRFFGNVNSHTKRLLIIVSLMVVSMLTLAIVSSLAASSSLY